MTLEVSIRHRQGAFVLNADFRCGPGLTALFGRSGAGKTTLINVIAGLIRPGEARVSVNGRVLVDTTAEIFLPPHKRKVGYVFQEARLFPHLSVRQNLLYGRWFQRGGHEGFDHVVALLGLGELLKRRPATLSGGERQRVAIGRALLARPHLLLLDEPLASLDAQRRQEILPYIERLRDETKIPIVYVSHALPEVTRLADNLVLLSRGRVEAVGPLTELTARLDLYPMIGRYEAGAVLSGTVLRHDGRYHLSEIETAAGSLLVPRLDFPEAARINLRIRARDVTLFLTRPQQSSALNVLEGTITEIARRDGPSVEVKLDCSGAALLARVTALSAERLGLMPGMTVFAAIKTVAMDRRGLIGLGPPDTAEGAAAGSVAAAAGAAGAAMELSAADRAALDATANSMLAPGAGDGSGGAGDGSGTG